MLYNLSGICSKEKAFGNPVDLRNINGVYIMTKSIANVVKSAEINTLESQGKALHTAWKRIVKAEKKQIVDFDLPLGKLMMSLAAEAGGNINKDRLQDCNIHNIPKQRRSEAKQLAELWDNLQDYLPRFTSTSAMLKAYKADNKPVEEPKAEQVADETTEGKTSDVGQTETQPKAKRMSPDDVAESVLAMLDANDITLAQFEASFASLAAILRDEDTNKKAVA